MLLPRLIARLDIKGPNVVKGIHFEGLRVMGKPAEMAERYANEGAHELLYIDTVASLYGRNQLEKLIAATSERCFIPITVGGGIKSVDDIRRMLLSGADKVTINSALLHDNGPRFLREAVDNYGSQAICVSIQAKRTGNGWECYSECGRQRTSRSVRDWASESVGLGAGEILLTSIDRDGTMKGCDLDLISMLSELPIPIVAGGGIGTLQHVIEALSAGADAVAIGTALHYRKLILQEVERGLTQSNLPRETGQVRAA